jgi:pyruvate/2-oxoglutarate dehydrogenase complex dihydrolipoamide dehydrogenase (E3) component
MSEVEHYDILAVGGGSAVKAVVIDMAKGGRRVALVERGLIGGSCINIACIPTKTLVRSAEIAHLAGNAAAFGSVNSQVATNMPDVRARTAGVVSGMVDATWHSLRDSGCEVIVGEGRFVGPREIEATLPDGNTRRLTADRIFLNLGTRAAIPNTPGLLEAKPLTHVEALQLDRLPEHLLILGGGYIGLEMAQAFRRLGSAVTIVERSSQLAAREDPDIGEAVQEIFREDGIDVVLAAKVTGVEGRSGDTVTLRLQQEGGESVLQGTDILVAAGRVPQTAGIGLEIAGVKMDERSFIEVDERLATSAPGIWAVGEAAGSPMFTHVAHDDARVAKSVILGGDRTTRGRLVPSVVFIDPELARIGISEGDAHRQSLAVRVARLPMSAVPRARTLSETRGFMKAVIDKTSDRILGFTMLGVQAGEVMSVVQTAIWGGLPYTVLRDGIYAHPTMAEGLNLLFANT